MRTAYQPSSFYSNLVLGSTLLLPAGALVLPCSIPSAAQERNERGIRGMRRQFTYSATASSIIPVTDSATKVEFSLTQYFPLPSTTFSIPLFTFNSLSPTTTPRTSTPHLSTTPSSFPSQSSVFPTSSFSSVSPAASNLLPSVTTIIEEGAINTGQSVTSRSSSVLPAIIGGVIGCLAAIAIGVCILLFRRRRRRKRNEENQRTVEKPFGTEAGFHLAVNPDSERDAVQPFLAPPSAPLRLAKEAPPSKSSLSTTLLSSSQSLSASSPSSAVSQQSLLDQLSMLRAQIQHVEELARINGVATSSIVDDRSSEPPPEYAPNATQLVGSERKAGDAILFPRSLQT